MYKGTYENFFLVYWKNNMNILKLKKLKYIDECVQYLHWMCWFECMHLYLNCEHKTLCVQKSKSRAFKICTLILYLQIFLLYYEHMHSKQCCPIFLNRRYLCNSWKKKRRNGNRQNDKKIQPMLHDSLHGLLHVWNG